MRHRRMDGMLRCTSRGFLDILDRFANQPIHKYVHSIQPARKATDGIG